MGNLNDKEKEFFVERLTKNGERILHKIESEVVEFGDCFNINELTNVEDNNYLIRGQVSISKVIVGDDGEIIPNE